MTSFFDLFKIYYFFQMAIKRGEVSLPSLRNRVYLLIFPWGGIPYDGDLPG
jgi:hypothetical protein